MRQSSQAVENEVILGIPRKRMVLWLTIAPMILMLCWVSWSVSKNRYVVTAEMVEMDAPSECWAASDGGIFSDARDAFRSRQPLRPYLGFCGVARTTMGDFALPPSKPQPWLGQKRSDIYTRLNPGCKYDLIVISPNGRPTERNRGRGSPNPPLIRRILFTYPC
ncbi:hypothetical protein TG4357_00192 [Thalassovita gelatinovora]|uniref:Uncharacterized protein n=1 Tax=Thalassovita gelatinovora TaxID=53501 RepID=A0A0N7LU59_THAGE|nr:hypothetical protein [Thalassovita gelatinovora]QIZ79330.1 hypothetical protein HFZ77_02005 [Thalassovita gelatinovora]CUH62586.1 hypothetical protein TG4357_00192 [Thalassovita gelatinovora]SEQ06900.1 hypothetical protein SAMN04488043_10392 [Thalassovita gelatinovora]